MTRGRKPDDYYLHERRTVPVFWPLWSDIQTEVEGGLLPLPWSDVASLTELAEATDVADTDLFLVQHAGGFQAVTYDTLEAQIVAAAAVPAATPPGLIAPFGGAAAPSGWLSCDGAAVSRTTYAALFAAIATLWGVGDGVNTFNLPDLRGVGIRGAGTNATRQDAKDAYYAGGAVGAALADQMQGHWHTLGDYAMSGSAARNASIITATATRGARQGDDANILADGVITDGTNGTPRIGAETRMATSSVLFVIKT